MMHETVDAPQFTALADRLQGALSGLFSVLHRGGWNHPSTGKLTMAQLSILLTLLERGPMRMTELAVEERVRTPTVTVAIQRLEKVGRVTRTRDPADQRAVLVDITPKGHAERRQAMDNRCAALAELLNGLSEQDRRALARALEPLQRLADQSAG
jgi:DNA-binding MarR family transcriptional regulator